MNRNTAANGRAPGAAWHLLPFLSSLRSVIVASFALLVVILVGVTVGAAWQQHLHQSDLAQLESRSVIASQLQRADAEAASAGLQLQRFAASHDETLPPEIENDARAATKDLATVAAEDAPPDMNEIAAQGTNLAEGAAAVIALEERGDTQAAALRLEEIVPTFHDFRIRLQDATASELRGVSSLRASADRTGTVTLWLLVLSGVSGAVVGGLLAVIVVASIMKPLGSLMRAVAAVSRGDLSARVEAGGPRELAQFGSVLNDMVTMVEKKTKDLRKANRVLQDRNQQLVDARAQAASDPLTGLGNHRSFHRRIRDEVANCERDDGRVGLAVLDIDGFKSINDSLGHQAGDEILRSLSLAMQTIVPADQAYRYGGDEFALILPGATMEETTQVAERLRGAVCDDGKVTISVGVTSFPEFGGAAEELIYGADMAMYWAKSTGKNRVGDWQGLTRRWSPALDVSPMNVRGLLPTDSAAGLTAALVAKDPGARGQIEKTCSYAERLADELGLDAGQKTVVHRAALLHHVGNLAMPADTLRKSGPLNESDWALVHLHPTVGTQMLEGAGVRAEVLAAIRHHHERYDGSGYPDGLGGADIPLVSRIISVCDAFEAMTGGRPYRHPWTMEAAIGELRVNAGTQFDPDIVEALLRVLSATGTVPAGSPYKSHRPD